jgi:hypothetical protein
VGASSAGGTGHREHSGASLAWAAVPIPGQVEQRPPELVIALLLGLIRTMLTPFVEVVAKQRGAKAQKHDATPPEIVATAQSEAPGDVSGAMG